MNKLRVYTAKLAVWLWNNDPYRFFYRIAHIVHLSCYPFYRKHWVEKLRKQREFL